MKPAYLIQVDAARNRRRWYSMHVQHDLFGNIWLICRWGRLGQKGGSERQIATESLLDAEAMCRNMMQRKKRRGYREPRGRHDKVATDADDAGGARDNAADTAGLGPRHRVLGQHA